MKKKLTLDHEIEAKIIDEKGWKRLRDCENKANLDPECELCLRASRYDRLLMSDEWRRVCPDCFDATTKQSGLTLEDLKGWNKFCISKQYFEHDELDLKCGRCAEDSCIDRWIMHDDWILVCPRCFKATTKKAAQKSPLIIKPCPAPVFRYPSRKMQEAVITSPPDGMPKLVNDQLYATDEIGYLKVKDKKARKEIKELKEKVEDLTAAVAVIIALLINNNLTSYLYFEKAVERVKKDITNKQKHE